MDYLVSAGVINTGGLKKIIIPEVIGPSSDKDLLISLDLPQIKERNLYVAVDTKPYSPSPLGRHRTEYV